MVVETYAGADASRPDRDRQSQKNDPVPPSRSGGNSQRSHIHNQLGIAQFGVEAALRVPGVASVGPSHPRHELRRHSSVLRQGADAVGVTEVGAEAVSLEFSLRVRPVTDVLSLAESVRSEVINELRRQADLEVSEVDISVDGIDLDEFLERSGTLGNRWL